MTSRLKLPRLSSEQKALLLGDVDAEERWNKRALRMVGKGEERDALLWKLLQAFLNQQGVHILRPTLNQTSISFASETASQQFHRFMLNARGRKT